MAAVKSVGNALRVLGAFLETGTDEVGVNEIARLLELSPSVTHRLMTTLRDRGFLEQDSVTRKYRVGLKALEVGRLYLKRHPFAIAAIRAVQEALPEYTCFAGTLSKDQVVILAVAEGTATIRVGAHPGERLYAHSTAIGKALLACFDNQEVLRILARVGMPGLTDSTIVDPYELLDELGRIREDGYAINDEESTRSVVSIGVPIQGSSRQPLGAFSVSLPKFMASQQRIQEIGNTLVRVAASLRVQLILEPPSEASLDRREGAR